MICWINWNISILAAGCGAHIHMFWFYYFCLKLICMYRLKWSFSERIYFWAYLELYWDKKLVLNSVNKLMTWSQTYYLSSVQMDELLPDRVYIFPTNGCPPFPIDDLFLKRFWVFTSKQIFYSLYEWILVQLLPAQMNHWTNDSPYDGPIPTPPEKWGMLL